ncbi:alpha/beta fold hydrolase [Streptomyces luteocolor]|uniref:alpha/beta fold hydrolase n=1 Tax=Streptomyces luteocolor TaxID=285500 RepID=UPI000852FBDB|nr:alpha/beta fold hydrolase [Streptomyces luteocolor]
MHRNKFVLGSVAVALGLTGIAACSPGSGGGARAGASASDRAGAVPEQVSPTQRSVRWKPCPEVEGGPKGVECGTVKVPVDWSEPGGEQIDIAVARRTAPQGARRVGSLMFLPGGPGMSGVEQVRQLPEWGGAEKRFDVVSFDPRGVGASRPLQCSEKKAMASALDSVPSATREEFERRTATAKALADDCARRDGKLLRHVDADSVTHDIEAIRVALGEKRLSLYSHSYGTVYAQRYAAAYGGRVRAAVLDGVMDQSVGRREFAATAAESLEDAYDQFARWCAKDDACALKEDGAWKTYERVARKAEDGKLPKSDVTDGPMTLAELNSTVDGMLLTPSWGPLAENLRTLDAGEKTDDVPAEDPAAGGGTPGVVPFADLVVCSDFALGTPDFAAHRDDVRAARDKAPRFGYSPNAVQYTNLCSGAGADSGTRAGAGGGGRTATSTAETPLLLMGARHDNATPIDWARSVRDQLGAKAALVEVDGWGHAAKIFNAGPEQDTVLKYLVDLQVPKGDAVVKGRTPDGL